MSKYDELVKKLKEIFQIDKPELDFGIYRILNARAVEINDYLEHRLKTKVQESLAVAGAANSEHIQKELIEAEKNAASLGASPDNFPKILELRQKLAEYSACTSEHENAVFTHLLTFFSRYYDKGDFVSQRRYKGGTYVIPYAGEEVIYHWANKDQYYTKSGENFSNYAFKLDDGRIVRFRLITADIAKDNRKDNDKERRFVLVEERIRTLIDDEGDEYEDTLMPLEEVDGELIIRFEYKVMTKGSKQEVQIAEAVKTVLENKVVKTNWLALSKREPTESNSQRTLLEKCLVSYTSKNTADYFIHKDLGRFLRGELDFYIKNEVMHLDDVQNAEKFADIEKNLRLIQTLRSIALDLVTFLAQLEDFQKKLWLKKKFVVSTNYCLTLDRVDITLHSDVATNSRQWEQWQQLGMVETAPNDIEAALSYLKSNLYLSVDTELYSNRFKEKILSTIDNLDGSLNGILINGDNFQALNLISQRYSGLVDGMYIDPPYNTNASEIVYKNGYKRSSWNSLIYDRLIAAKTLLRPEGIKCVTIDDYAVNELQNICKEVYPEYELRNVIIEYNHRGRVKSNFATTHEYGVWLIPEARDLITRLDEYAEDIQRNLRRTGNNSLRADSPSMFYGIEVNKKTLEIISVTNAIPFGNDFILSANPETKIIYPIDSQGNERNWYFGRARVLIESKRGEVWAKIINNEIQIHYRLDGKQKRRKSVWTGKKLDASTHGSELLNSLFKLSQFSFPKSIYAVKDSLASMTKSKDALFLDYFAGSGTTGHAAISLNRDDLGNRKYILVEQGEYFDTVTKPRIQKAVYSADWKDGKATKPETGISHAFKVVKIESYEDTLNNLQLRLTSKQQDMISSMTQSAQDDYLLRYMLDIESRGSLLSVEQFNMPFDCKLKVAVDSAGAYEERPIDLVETFNYLIGLHVEQIDYQLEKGFVRITGKLPTGEKTLVLWRDTEKMNYLALSQAIAKLSINPADDEFDIVYINGDHNIPSVFTATEADGGITKKLALRQIEPEFLSRMFAVDNELWQL